ncbi:hypothetical protein L209DRAFT_57031 [Thermothelomyces heterothallicus CBS 203.75]
MSQRSSLSSCCCQKEGSVRLSSPSQSSSRSAAEKRKWTARYTKLVFRIACSRVSGADWLRVWASTTLISQGTYRVKLCSLFLFHSSVTQAFFLLRSVRRSDSPLHLFRGTEPEGADRHNSLGLSHLQCADFRNL